MSVPTLFPLILSNTDLSAWSSCELRWFRERCQNWRKSSFNNDLAAGGSFAKGLELVRKSYYNDKLSANDSVDLGYYTVVESLHEEMARSNIDTDTLKSPERMGLALREYFRRFPLEMEEVIPAELEDGSHAIEHKMTVELPILHPELDVPLIFKGKLDMFAQSMGRTYIVDEKTTKAIKSNEADMLATSGQFIGYAWLAREKGIRVVGAKIRKVAIQVREIKVEEFEVPITDYQIDLWYDATIAKITEMVAKYKQYLETGKFKDYFIPDFQNGCTAFYKPCGFQDGCKSKYGENFIQSTYEQLVWDGENRQEVPLTEFRTLLGLSV